MRVLFVLCSQAGFAPQTAPRETIPSRILRPGRRRLATQPDDRGRVRIAPIEAPCFEAITPAQVAAFIEAMIKRQGIAPKTANHYRSILRRVFNWSTRQHGLRIPGSLNPAAQIDAYRQKERSIRYLTLLQINEQLHALRTNPQLQTMVAVLIYAGLGRAELLWLTLDDLQLPSLTAGKPGILQIRPKAYEGYTWNPKTSRCRVVPVSSTLRQHLDRYTPRPSQPGAPGQGWLFPSPKGRRWEEDNFSTDLRETNGKYGLTWSCLDYRHTFGSHLAQKDVSLYKISQLMGNSPEICRKHYAALVPQQMAEEVEF